MGYGCTVLLDKARYLNNLNRIAGKTKRVRQRDLRRKRGYVERNWQVYQTQDIVRKT